MRPAIVAMAIVLAMLEQNSEAVVPPCDGMIDLVFIIHSSASIGPRNFEKEKSFIANIANYFVLGAENNLISLIGYNYNNLVFPFNATMTNQDIQQAVMNVPYAGASTATDEALFMTSFAVFSDWKPFRPEADKVIVLLTSGRSNDLRATLIVATRLKSRNVTINIVGIGPAVDEQEIRNISSGEKYTFFADSFDSLDTVQTGIVSNICGNNPSCDGMINLLFIIHASPLIGADNYELQKKFVVDISKNVVVGAKNILISLIFFNVSPRFGFEFNDKMTNQDIEQAVMNVPFEKDSANTFRAFRTAEDLMFTSSYGSRPDADKTVVILTGDKSSYPEDTLTLATALKRKYVKINGVGIGPTVDKQEIRNISSGEKYTFFAGSFDDLDTLEERIVSSVCEVIPSCYGMTDLLFIIAASDSAGADNFEHGKRFIADISNNFVLGAKHNLISLIVFNDDAFIAFPFNTNMTHKDIHQAVMSVQYEAGSTNTAGALQAASERAFTSSNGARTGATKVVVIITDSVSDDSEDAIKQATALKNTNVTITSVGVGSGIDVKEIESISSSEKYVFFAESFDDLGKRKKRIANTVCDVIRPCYGMADILFIIISPVNVGNDAFQLEKLFVTKVSKNFVLGANNHLISVIVFGGEASIVFPFDPNMTHQDIEKASMNASLERKYSNIHKALQLANEKAFTSSNGARPQAKKFLVLLTTSPPSNSEETFKQVSALKSSNVTINTVPIGFRFDAVSGFAEEMRNISSGEKYAFSAINFEYLDKVRKGIVSNVCGGHDD